MNDGATARVPAGVYLTSCLAPFEHLLSRPDVTDIYVNRPGELWVEIIGGQIERIQCEAICELTLARFARQIAALSHQAINRTHPLLATTLPDGSRVQVIAPPATRGDLALAIRRQIATSMTLKNFAFGDPSGACGDNRNCSDDDELRRLVDRRRFAEALGLAVRTRRNIIVSGGTSTGKTTFVNALLREIPPTERLIVIEDTPELEFEHENCVGLVAVRGELGEAQVTVNDLVSASLRMRPDRIILGELRGPEAFAFLRAVNSGHPGSMTTIHADSPERAIEQLAMLILHDGAKLTRKDVHHYVSQSIDLFVQLHRVAGRRFVESVVFGREVSPI